jgi:Serine dehydrogenase proteinase
VLHDVTLVFASISEKALRRIKLGAMELIGDKLPEEQAKNLVDKLAGGEWTHDYGLIAKEAQTLALNVKTGITLLDPRPDAALPATGQAGAVD